MNYQQPHDHEENSETGNQASDDATTSKGIAQDVDTTPSHEATAAPQTQTKHEHAPSYWSKIPEAIVYWLHHYWDAPREKSKKTEVAMVILTLAIAIAAFWSGCIFQGQLTIARQVLESQTRPWVNIKSISVNPDSNFVIQHGGTNGLNMSLDFTLENFGQSPSERTAVAFTSDFVPNEIKERYSVHELMDRSCREADGQSEADTVNGTDPGIDSVFPGDTGVVSKIGYGVAADNDNPSGPQGPTFERRSQYRVRVFGCIAYQATVDSSHVIHHTKLLYQPIYLKTKPQSIDILQLLGVETD